MKDNYTFLDLDGVILDSEQRIVNLKSKNPDLKWWIYVKFLDTFFGKMSYSVFKFIPICLLTG